MQGENESQQIHLGNSKTSCCRKFVNVLKSHTGIFLGILSGSANVIEQVIAKDLIKDMTTGEIFVCRFSVHFLWTVLLMMRFEKKYLPDECEVQDFIPRVFLNVLTLLCSYLSFLYIPYLESLVVNYGNLCLWSAVLGHFMLSERIDVFTLVTMFVVFAGVVMDCRPALFFNSEVLWSKKDVFIFGYFWAFLAGLTFAIMSYYCRKINKTPAILTSFYIGIVGLGIGIVLLIQETISKGGTSLNWNLLKFALLSGTFSVIAITLWSYALQKAKVTEASIAVQIEIPVGVLLSWVILHKVPTVYTGIGSTLVFLGIFSLILKDICSNQDKKGERQNLL